MRCISPSSTIQGKYRFDLGPILALGIGLTTIGMMFVAIGLSSQLDDPKNQVVAAMLDVLDGLMLLIGRDAGWSTSDAIGQEAQAGPRRSRYVSVMSPGR